MTILPLNDVKTRFSAIADEVAATHDRVIVTRNGRPHVMVISIDDFESLQMTRELLAEPGAVQDILAADQEISAGDYHTLDDLRAALEEAGAEVVDAGVARDVREELVARLHSAAATDLIISTGGVSMGAYDLVRALVEEQAAVDFWQVALRPGKPLLVGTIEGRPLIGLPGNPVSTLVGVELFVRPAILKMQGRTDLERPRVTAITEAALSNPPHLEQYFRGVARRDGGRVVVRLTGDQGSHVLRSMADANCLIVVPQGTSDVPAGASVEVIPLAPID